MSYNIPSVVNIDWKPDRNSNISLSRQIVTYVSKKIFNGDWIIGQKLPSQRKLADFFEVNRSTIVDALEQLSSIGVIEGNLGRGTTIINNTWSLLMANSPLNWQRYIESGIFKANSPTIQKINKMDFVDGIARLGTDQLSPDLLPQKLIKKALMKIPASSFSISYIEPLGLLKLRQVLSKYLMNHGIKAPPSCILIVSGSLQALQLISLCMLRPKSTVFIEIPSYLKSINVFQSAGIKLCGIPMDSDGIMPWMINKNIFKTESSLLYTMPTFHNPSGKVMSDTRKTELMNYCSDNCLPIIEDDISRELWIDELPPLPIKAYDKNGIVLYLGSISKSIAPGLRLGWVVGPESVIQRLSDVKMQVDYGVSSLSQLALAELIESGMAEEHLDSLRKNLKARRDIVLKVLEDEYKDMATWDKPSGGLFIWLRLNVDISTDKLFELALNNNILICPGNIYDFTKNQYIRISYAYASEQDLSSGLIKLAKIIRSMIQK